MRGVLDTVMQIALAADVVLRPLSMDDGDRFGGYFEGLSPATTTRLQPHPLTREQAVVLCGSPATEGTAMRLVLEHDGSVIAYFILEHQGGYQTDVWNHDMRLVLNG